MGNNGKDNVKKITEAHNLGKGNILAKHDAEYLRWVRLGANDTQLLALRDELRAHRANQPIHEANTAAHEQLQSEALVLVRMLGTMMYQHLGEPDTSEDVEVLRADSVAAQKAVPEPKEVLRIRRMNESDLNEIGNMLFHISTTDGGETWIFQLQEAPSDAEQ